MRPAIDRLHVLLPGIALLMIVAASACSEPCPRIAIAGLVAPLPAPLPAPGLTLQELPPLSINGVWADGPHGGTMMAIDARSVLDERGEAMPAWRPPPAPATADEARSVTQRLLQLTALIQALSQADRQGAMPCDGSPAMAPTLAALARSLDAVLRDLTLSGDAQPMVNARAARVLQEQAQARLRAGTLPSAGDPAPAPALVVYDPAREYP